MDYYEKHIAKIKDKYNLPQGLEVEGARKTQKTLQDFIDDNERRNARNDALRGRKLAVGNTTYQGKKMSIWFDLRG
ncbi:MAG: hypothetical protein JWQ71_986 [Pedosphaera sp.]|nr:hypothetical protein [Pedosphaera sp.]